ncbi:TetR/AcrR family transcriptional regulator [Nocardia acidivorans]|uniref:TetR/AcrR family transcriptional regulator n=1 Tax=Nocardia acidivorans TaxID=404580 RepID=UPI00083623E3|nr:TetR/AcrR family transcriptional regulator [Nocardia acidivorans]
MNVSTTPVGSGDEGAIRPSLAERRKEETRREIARVAARLFAERGTSAVTAEEIAEAAGLARRTFHRYCPTKEEAVEPIMSAGAARWVADLAAGPARMPTVEELCAAAVRALTPRPGSDELAVMRGLFRAMDTDRALRSVWYLANLEGERALRGVLTDLTGADSDPLRIRLTAAAANAALRVAIEQWAATDAPALGPGSPADLVVECMRDLTASLPLWDTGD